MAKKDQAAADAAAGQTDASADTLTGAPEDQLQAAAATGAPEGAGGASPDASASAPAPEQSSEVPTTEDAPEPAKSDADPDPKPAQAEAEPTRATYLTVVTSERYGHAGHFVELTADEADEGLNPPAPAVAEGDEPQPAPDPVLAVPTPEQLARRP